jgi:hypothetical protein
MSEPVNHKLPADGGDPIDTFVINIENLNHIQRDVLVRLKTVDSVAYSGLKPDELTGNAFNYHLRHVVAQDLVYKTDDQRYVLTAKGRLLVDNVSLDSMKLKLRPTVGMALVLESSEHGVLLYRSNRAPLRELVGLPFGKLRLGDSLDNTFSRILRKRGIDRGSISGIEPLGMANIRYFDKDQLVVHRVVAVWSASYDGTAVTTSTGNGSSFWQKDHLFVPGALPEVGALVDWRPKQGIVEINSSLP